MTGKSGASGGAREGAGRPQETYEDGQPIGTTPIEMLWRFLAEHHGQEAANAAHLYFNEQKRAYEQKRRDRILAERERDRRAARLALSRAITEGEDL